MKTIKFILATFIGLSLNQVSAQCIANAGPDKIICTNMFGVDTTQIGTSPAVTGGTPPYIYRWTAHYTKTIGSATVTKTASDYLNDTTLATPLIIASEDEPVEFTLTVKDNIGNNCSDTTIISFSRFMMTLGYQIYTIASGDSIYLNSGVNISSNYPPFHYLWRPSESLTDSTSLSFWAKPAVSTTYYVTLTDSANCSMQAAPYYYVLVSPEGVNEFNNNVQISAYPNPSNSTINIHVDGIKTNILYVDFFDLSGKQIIHIESETNEITLNSDAFPRGVIFYKISDQKHLIGNGKLIID